VKVMKPLSQLFAVPNCQALFIMPLKFLPIECAVRFAHLPDDSQSNSRFVSRLRTSCLFTALVAVQRLHRRQVIDRIMSYVHDNVLSIIISGLRTDFIGLTV
jgi:hypothetical protein